MMNWKTRTLRIHESVAKNWTAYSAEDVRFLALALCGEVGELANIIKKEWRGDSGYQQWYTDESLRQKIREELADIQIYLHILANGLDVDLDKAAQEITDTKLKDRWPDEYNR